MRLIRGWEEYDGEVIIIFCFCLFVFYFCFGGGGDWINITGSLGQVYEGGASDVHVVKERTLLSLEF